MKIRCKCCVRIVAQPVARASDPRHYQRVDQQSGKLQNCQVVLAKTVTG